MQAIVIKIVTISLEGGASIQWSETFHGAGAGFRAAGYTLVACQSTRCLKRIKHSKVLVWTVIYIMTSLTQYLSSMPEVLQIFVNIMPPSFISTCTVKVRHFFQ